jgi:NDP-sugar pyrophosphorylase family protein
MLPFQGKPFLEHWLDKLRTIEVLEVIINVHHLADAVWNPSISSGPSGCDTDFHLEDTQQGTNHAMGRWQAMS